MAFYAEMRFFSTLTSSALFSVGAEERCEGVAIVAVPHKQFGSLALTTLW